MIERPFFLGLDVFRKNAPPNPPQLTILPTSLAFPRKEIYNDVASWPMMTTGCCLPSFRLSRLNLFWDGPPTRKPG